MGTLTLNSLAMKKTLLFLFLTVLFCTAIANSQTPLAAGRDYLGVLCRIDVNTKLDETINGYATYDIPLIRNKVVYLYGPGRPQLTPDGKLQLWLKEIERELMDDDSGIEYIEVAVYKPYGTPPAPDEDDNGYWNHPEYLGYYVIELVVKTSIY